MNGRAGFGTALLALLASLVLLLTACESRPERAQTADLEEVPQLDLRGAEESARRQLEEQRARLEILLADPKTSARDLAKAFGDLGLLFVPYDFLEAAQVCFENARRLQPEDVRWPYLEGYLLQAQGRLGEALERYDRALDLDPETLAAVLRSGRAHLALGQVDEAEASFQRAVALSSSTAAGHEGLGRVAMERGDLQAAVSHFTRALDLEPRATALHYSLSQAYRALGDAEQAELHLRQRGDLGTRVPDPLISALATRAASSQFYLMQGAEALEDENYLEAAASYRQALDLEPESIAALRGLSASLAGRGDLAGAAEALQKALVVAGTGDDSRQERAGLLRSLGDLLARGGRPLQAAAVYRQSLEMAPEQQGLEVLQADALARGGRFEDALRLYEKALAEGDGRPASRLLVKKATVLVNLGRGEDARAAFQKAVEGEPENPGIRLRFSETLAFLGDPAGAARQRAAARQRIPAGAAGAPLWLEMALSAQRSGDGETAEREYHQALEEDPRLLEAHVGLANLQVEAGRWPEAIAELEANLAKNPRHRASHQALVRALVLSGQFGEARVQLQESLKALPRDVDLALDQVRLLASCPDPAVRDAGLALEIALRVREVSGDASTRAALALAHGAAGQWDAAIALQGRLVEEAKAKGDPVYTALFTARLRSFEEHRPWTASSGEEILDRVR